MATPEKSRHSDVDLIADFEPGCRFTLVDMVRLENRLRDVDKAWIVYFAAPWRRDTCSFRVDNPSRAQGFAREFDRRGATLRRFPAQMEREMELDRLCGKRIE